MPDRTLRDRLIELENPATDLDRGRALRKRTPRRSLARLTPSPRAAVEILLDQNETRLPELVPLRFARMLADPFAFYRGTAAVMAADLAAGPSSGIDVMCCGDAHLGSAHASVLRGYVGTSDAVANAIIEWSFAYADKSLDDFHQLRAAARARDIDVAESPAR